MNISKTLKEAHSTIQDTIYILKMMEDVFGHRVTTWTPRDTRILKTKIRVPITDKGREDYVKKVLPLMQRKTLTTVETDPMLKQFLDLYSRIKNKELEDVDDREEIDIDKIMDTDNF
ncbi:hypothetical protein [Microcystis phage Mel-JY01]